MSKPTLPGPSRPPNWQPSPEMLQQFLDLQTSEMQLRLEDQKLRHRELDIQAKENDHAASYSKDSLQVQAEYLKDERRSELSKFRWMICSAIGVLLLLFCFILVLFHWGKDQAAMDTLKIAGGFVAGGGVGTWVGWERCKKSMKAADEKASS